MIDKMIYDKPPDEWMEGLPIGNGRLAAMVWGDAKKDVLSLNHEWLWRGINKNRETQDVSVYLKDIRKLLTERKFSQATEYANNHFGGSGGISSLKDEIDSYQPAGNIVFKIDNVNKYIKRELDISTGIVTTFRDCVKSEFFTDCVRDSFVFNWTGETMFSGELSFERCEYNDAVYSYDVSDNTLKFHCAFNGGIEYRVQADIFTDGFTLKEKQGVRIFNATYIRLIANIGTSVKGIEKELCHKKNYDFEMDKKEHSNRFSYLMNRVKLNIETDKSFDGISTSERVENMKVGINDNGIAKLYFDYGRYLLLSCSICGELPANLQGKWNDRIDPPWSSDYHFDINLQMNYWMSEPVNMPECVNPLISYLERFMESGKKAARDLYNCRGVYIPLCTDAWASAKPEARGWDVWIGGAPWMAQHLWQHYIYTGDKEYLKNRAYKFFVAVAEFYEDYLVEDENGIMQIMPSQSPENRFEGAGDAPVSICVSSAMDVQLAYDALNYVIKSSEILCVDAERIPIWKKLQSKLPDFKIGSDGRLLEWNEEKREIEQGHRHLSHLYGLYPSDLFNIERRPEQYQAAIKSLHYRLSKGGGHTGWSRAWTACLFARTGDAYGFFEHYTGLIRDFATVSLLDLHPPRIFQIDGNLGAVAALVEAIVSFTDNKVYFLRALPKEWNSGFLHGIKVPGGHTINIDWKDGKIIILRVELGYQGNVTVQIDGKDKYLEGKPGEVLYAKV